MRWNVSAALACEQLVLLCPGRERQLLAFIASAGRMTVPGYPVLAVDLAAEEPVPPLRRPGRALAAEICEIHANLSIGNIKLRGFRLQRRP